MSATLEVPSPPPAEDIRPDVSHLITEDDTPVDNPFCEKQMRLLTHPLYASWNPGLPFTVMANVGVYFALNKPPLVPDTLLTLGVAPPADLKPKEHRAYFTWIYGKSPDVVIEIVSNKEGGELDRKMHGYAQMRVPFYVVFDPDQLIQRQRLRSFVLNGSRYEEIADARFGIEGVNFGLVEWEGEFENQRDGWIRWTDAAGQLIPTGEENATAAIRRAEVESHRAEVESHRAEVESHRAEAESRRAEAMAARLRELGVDPASLI